jgi:hypothetical protein
MPSKKEEVKLATLIVSGYLVGAAVCVGIIYLLHHTNFFEALDNLSR